MGQISPIINAALSNIKESKKEFKNSFLIDLKTMIVIDFEIDSLQLK